MSKVLVFILFLCVSVVIGQQRLASSARIKDHTEFFTQVIQETVYEVERLGFSTLKLTDFTQNINDRMYNWNVSGTVEYTNGFVVSIQKIDVTTMTQHLGNPTIDGVVTPRATVSGTMNLRDIKLGYDVIYTPVDGPVQRYTGDHTHVLITWAISIIKDLTTNEITVTFRSGLSGGLIRTVYRPANSITEVLSRHFFPYNNANGVATWATIFEPIILDVIKNKVEFPEVCFRQC